MSIWNTKLQGRYSIYFEIYRNIKRSCNLVPNSQVQLKERIILNKPCVLFQFTKCNEIFCALNNAGLFSIIIELLLIIFGAKRQMNTFILPNKSNASKNKIQASVHRKDTTIMKN